MPSTLSILTAYRDSITQTITAFRLLEKRRAQAQRAAARHNRNTIERLKTKGVNLHPTFTDAATRP